ncbi:MULTISPECIES: hypothetical protein [Frankia]|nr:MULTISPECIES: hypothetical protein [Frankia]
MGHDAVDPGETDAPPPGGWFGLRVLPAGWMRGLLTTVTGLVTVVVALGDLASAWVVGVLPVTVGAMVAYHEVLERLIHPAGNETLVGGPASAQNPPGDQAVR